MRSWSGKELECEQKARRGCTKDLLSTTFLWLVTHCAVGKTCANILRRKILWTSCTLSFFFRKRWAKKRKWWAIKNLIVSFILLSGEESSNWPQRRHWFWRSSLRVQQVRIVDSLSPTFATYPLQSIRQQTTFLFLIFFCLFLCRFFFFFFFGWSTRSSIITCVFHCLTFRVFFGLLLFNFFSAKFLPGYSQVPFRFFSPTSLLHLSSFMCLSC